MTTDADDTSDREARERAAARSRSNEVWRAIEESERAAARLFWPSPIIERLLWQVCGAWETVIEEARFFHYVLDEDPPTAPPFPRPDGENVARDLRRIGRKLNLRLPRDDAWTDECKRAKTMRDDLGHMLHFLSITGETPEQSVTIRRVPYKEPDEMSTDGTWARHNRKDVTITETEAREVLAGLKYVNDSIFALRKFGMEFAAWTDNHDTREVLGIMPWWLEDWGPEPGQPGWKVPTMGELRSIPQHEFIASLPESMRPVDWPLDDGSHATEEPYE